MREVIECTVCGKPRDIVHPVFPGASIIAYQWCDCAMPSGVQKVQSVSWGNKTDFRDIPRETQQEYFGLHRRR